MSGTTNKDLLLLAMLAYSALDEGNVFGNAGLRVMFNDADDLGRLMDDARTSSRFLNLKAPLAQLLVQYAGGLAAGSVMYDRNGASANGVLSVSSDALTVDFRTNTWSASRATSATSLVKPEDLLDKSSDNDASQGDAASARKDYEALGKTVEVERVVIAITDDGSRMAMTGSEAGSAKFAAFAGGDGVEDITESCGNDFVAGAFGDDTIRGMGGDNLIAGGEANDDLRGGDQIDIIYGGFDC